MTKPVDIIPYAFGNAAQNTACALGADQLKNALLKTDFATHLIVHPSLSTPHRTQQQHALPDVVQLNEALAQITRESVLHRRFFITLGGDHTVAIGSWSGAAAAIQGDLGLIWFDAHMDSHTPQTSPSQNIHGMPFAILLGQGYPALTTLLSEQPKVKPENCALIAVRSYEPGEAALLKKLGVKIFYMDDIKKNGLHQVLLDALHIVTRHTHHFGISIDLDGFDPTDAPGVGTRAPDGVCAHDFLAEFSIIAHHPKLIGADIAEFNPTLDSDHKTEKLAVALCCEFINR